MVNVPFTQYKIEDRSYISLVKREIHALLNRQGFSASRTGEADIIVSELTSNLIKHAGQGEVLYRVVEWEDDLCFEIYCIDNGPGMDVNLMMRDGASSSNTLGHGLGALNRLSTLFQVYSMRKWGTVVFSRLLRKRVNIEKRPRKKEVMLKGLQVNIPGEAVCGDGYWLKETGDGVQIFLGDGLGHGQHAHDAVQEAIEAFKECSETSPVEILRYIHQKVRRTRGLVGTVITMDRKRDLKLCGIGNISTRLCNGISSRNYLSNNGILGLNMPNTMNDVLASGEDYQYIIMCSDGIKTRWDLNKYVGFFKCDAAIQAGIIYKDNARGTDDMTVLIGKINM